MHEAHEANTQECNPTSPYEQPAESNSHNASVELGILAYRLWFMTPDC